MIRGEMRRKHRRLAGQERFRDNAREFRRNGRECDVQVGIHTKKLDKWLLRTAGESYIRDTGAEECTHGEQATSHR